MLTRNLSCALLGAIMVCSALPAQGECGLHSVRGTWAMTALGWATPLQTPEAGPVPIVMIGVAVIDHTGRMTGPGTAVWGGQVLDYELVDGTVQVNADCTGTLKYGVKLKGAPAPVPGQYIERMIIIPEKHEMASVSVQSPLSKPMWLTTAKRISPAPAPVTW
ncbi:MAG: hypothetical protein AAB225_18530 [Acidobacteriota bacterium]